VIIRNPNSVRPWQHVLEPILGYLLLGTKMINDPTKFSESFNFGPDFNDALPVKEMVEQSLKCWGSGAYDIVKIEGQLHEAGLLKLDINKAIHHLGWTPTFDAPAAIDKTMGWYKKYLTNPDEIVAFTEQQVHEYFKPII
jgi:CDP-glucose 4,6-dehydratase